MSIQKKSLLSAINTTKKAIVAGKPEKAAAKSSTRLAVKDATRLAAGKAAPRYAVMTNFATKKYVG